MQPSKEMVHKQAHYIYTQLNITCGQGLGSCCEGAKDP